MTNYIDWEDMVTEYKQQYDDEDGIIEFVDSLVPVYYHDIFEAFNKYCIGNNMIISKDDVGLPMWQVMTKYIFEAYYEAFINEWDGFDEEE